MLAKITAKNQLTLPKSLTQAVGATEYFDVQARDGQLILTPVRIQRGDAVRANIESQTIDPSKKSQYVTTGLGKNGEMKPDPVLVVTD